MLKVSATTEVYTYLQTLSLHAALPIWPIRIAIPCASAHPTALVESIAMGSITAPRPSYVPKLPAGVVDKRVLSDAQLETLIYAGDAFERDISGLFKEIGRRRVGQAWFSTCSSRGAPDH